MSSASKQKGSAHERAVVDYLKTHGWKHAERRLAGDKNDRGDIAGVPGIVLECKNEKRIDLAQFMLSYDPSAEDPEVESQSYEFCRKCKQIKKNFVGEGRRKLCMDCAFGDSDE